MYFQARSHEIIEVASAADAVLMVHEGRAKSFQCPTWRNARGQRVCLVDDSHINGGAFGECAVVNLDTKRQLESITFAWIQTQALKVAVVEACQDADGYSEVTVPFSDADKDVPASFECSCCGEWFTSTLREQEPHDQDAGFGHCPACFPSAIHHPATR